METRAANGGSVQIVNFQSDLPFQYKKQVLDANTILLRLYNARLAQNLITPEGAVNLLASGAVQSARLKSPASIASEWDSTQDVILTGPGLGSRTIRVIGADELMVVANKADSPSDHHVMMARVPNQSQRKTTGSKKSAKKGSYANLGALAASGGIIQDDNHGNGNAPAQWQARPNILEAPRIEPEVVSTQQLAQVSPTDIDPSESGRNSLNLVDAGNRNTVYDGNPTVENQVVTPLPRYTGGAKPIEAMTTDNQGHPVLIKPKAESIPEFAINNRQNGGYNTLFQAELTDQQRIGQFLRDALTAYKANQFALAQKQVQQALLLDANNADLLAALAEIQLKQGEPTLAEQNYAKAHSVAGEKYGTRYAQVLTLDGKRHEAIQVLETLYRQNPKQVQVAYMLGTLNEEIGETSRALTYLQQAAQLHPASADIQYNLGLAYELSGDREQAEKHYRQALGLSPNASDVVKALARVRQGGM